MVLDGRRLCCGFPAVIFDLFPGFGFLRSCGQIPCKLGSISVLRDNLFATTWHNRVVHCAENLNPQSA